jgi:hypothetical protein
MGFEYWIDYVGNRRKDVDENREKSQDERSQIIGRWVATGIAIGAGLGVVFSNIALGVGIGLCLGVAIGASQAQKTDGEA